MHLTAETEPVGTESQKLDTEQKNLEDLTPEKDGGVLKEVLRAGEGDEGPLTGDKVSVHYVGTLAEVGSQFDSSRDRGEQFEFVIGKGQVIKAWDLGVASMRRGELSRLICRSEYAYGDSGSPPKIPGGATLIFEVELFDWVSGEDISPETDGGIMKVGSTGGEGYGSPNEGAWVKVDLKGAIKGSQPFDERTVEFELGEGCDMDIPEGIEKGIEKLKKKETCILKLQPKYAFGSAGNERFGVPPDTAVEYTVTLIDFEKAKESWEMSQEEKIEQAKVHKDKGTKYFKEEKYKLAMKQYSKVTDLMSYDSGLDDDKKQENHALKLAGELNLAAVCLKIKDYVEVKKHTTSALEQDPDNVKAYFRRGQALLHMEDYEAAIDDFKKVLSLDASNGAAKKQLHEASEKLKQHRQREKQLYSGMFEKFARADASRAVSSRKGGPLKDGVGEWDDKKEEEEEKKEEGDLSGVQLLSTGDQIKGDEFMTAS